MNLVRTASLSRDAGHMDHYAHAKQNAKTAAETVRRFMGQVTDSDLKNEIEKWLLDLDRLISTL